MSRPIRWLLGIAAVLAAALLLRFTVLRASPTEVTVAAAATGVVEDTVTNTRAGTVKVRRRAKLSPQIGGRVVAIPFRKGARVTAGAVLLRLDDSVQKAQLALAEEDVRTAHARAEEACLAAELAERELERGQALRRDGIASEQTLDTLQSARDRGRASCRAAGAVLQQAEAQVRLAQAELALTAVTAPFPGVVADCSTEVGEWITPSPPAVPLPAVLDVLDPTSSYVSAPIDEVDSARVMPGQEARVTVDSLPGRHFPGTVVRVAPYVLDVLEQNRTVELEVEFTDPAAVAAVLPGTSADVEVILARREKVLRIPTSAVGQGSTVLVLEGGTLHERTVEEGLRNWQFTEVRSGLGAGERVVTVRDSAAVKAGARAVARSEP